MQPRNTGREILGGVQGRGRGVRRRARPAGLPRRAARHQRLRPRPGGARHASTSSSSAACCCTCATRSPRWPRCATVCGGEAVIAETVDLWPSLTRPRTPTARLEGIERPWWWQPNRAALPSDGAVGRLRDPRGHAGLHPPARVSAHPAHAVAQAAGQAAVAPRVARRSIVSLRGIPHAAVRVRPLPSMTATQASDRAGAGDSGWYHALELPGVTTEGIFDMRQYVGEYGLPDSLAGKRVLEVGTWDGFWAFEFERRGAEVVAHRPRRRGRPRLAAAPARPRTPSSSAAPASASPRSCSARRSSASCKSVYHATPEELGTFDLVFCGSVLLHLRDQLLALERIADLVKPGGMFITAEEYEPVTDLIPFPVARFRGNRDAAVVFWVPSREAWREMLWHAGFDRVEEVNALHDAREPGLEDPPRRASRSPLVAAGTVRSTSRRTPYRSSPEDAVPPGSGSARRVAVAPPSSAAPGSRS